MEGYEILKQELERIWQFEPCAFPLHIAGWRFGRSGLSKLLTAIRYRKVSPIKRMQKAVDKA